MDPNQHQQQHHHPHHYEIQEQRQCQHITVLVPEEQINQNNMYIINAREDVKNGSRQTDMLEAKMPSANPEFQKGLSMPPIPGVEYIDGYPTLLRGRSSANFYCKTCQKVQMSNTFYKMGKGGWIWCGFFSFVFPCVACCPCCFQDCQDVIHQCPSCGREVGKNRYCVDSGADISTKYSK